MAYRVLSPSAFSRSSRGTPRVAAAERSGAPSGPTAPARISGTTGDYTAGAGKLVGVPALTAPPTAADVMALLRGVIDPELGGNIVDLGMATGASVSSDGEVTVAIKLTIGGCPLRS